MIIEANKFDPAVAPASINGITTGKYFGMCEYRRALFAVMLGVIAAGETSEIQVMQAVDASGTDAKVITGATVTVTANENAGRVKLAIVTAAGGVHVAGQTVTINGLIFTAAAADNPLTREYAVGASGADSAAALLAKINSEDEDIGVPDIIGVSSVVSTDTILSLKAIEPGEITISAVASAATTIVSTIEAMALVEIAGAAMDVNNGFTHVAVKITNSAATQTAATCVRGDARYTPEQFVAGEVSVLS